VRAQIFAALGDPVRLAIVDELVASDRSPAELQERFGTPSNLLTHHLDVLERAGLISRRRSAGDGRRRYLQLDHAALPGPWPATRTAPHRVLFVCTHNSARSPLAAALWRRATGRPAVSAGTNPASRVHPGAIAAARRRGVELGDVAPQHIDLVADRSDLVVTVCDQAHEELGPSQEWLHWSVPDPVTKGSAAAFDAARDDLQRRVEALAHSVSASPG
jgi:protein-tyrosine-phosphatase/DNA-binding transcriptional ArsR family regulator